MSIEPIIFNLEDEDSAYDCAVRGQEVIAAKELEHEPSSECWCDPELVYKDPINSNKVWLHRRIQ